MSAVIDAGSDLTIHGMNQAYGNANSRAMEAANHFNLATEYAYLQGVNNMTNQQAMAYRSAAEAGSGRTRVESNTPASTQTVGP